MVCIQPHPALSYPNKLTLKCFRCSWSPPVWFLKQIWFSWSHLGKIPAFSQPQNGVAGEDKICHIKICTCNTSTGGIFMALQENPEGFGGGISSSLLTAKLQSAVANCTFQVSPTLQFHVKNCHPCPGNVTKLCSAVKVFIPLTEQKELLVPKRMMNMEIWNATTESFGPVGRLMDLGNAGVFFLPLQPSSIQNLPIQHLPKIN